MEFDLPILLDIELTNKGYGKLTARVEGFMDEKLFKSIVKQATMLNSIEGIEIISYGATAIDKRFGRFIGKLIFYMPNATIMHITKLDQGLWKFSGERFPCRRCMNGFTVLWDGRVTICANDRTGIEEIGDLKKQSLLGIWNSDKAKAKRREHKQKVFTGLCVGCSFNCKPKEMVDGPQVEVVRMGKERTHLPRISPVRNHKRM